MAESYCKMKDIGSIFPIYKNNLTIGQKELQPTGKILYSLCREALLVVARSLSSTNKIVLLPAYTCDTVYMPFKQEGWKCIYYSINKDLRINIPSLKEQFDNNHPALIIAHPYYGTELNHEEIETLKELKNLGSRILIDNTQCIFSDSHLDFVDYYVGSYRKWFPVPDGGYLECKDNNIPAPNEENMTFVSLQTGAMYLRGEYFDTSCEEIKQLSIQLNKAAELHAVGIIEPHAMSSFSMNTLKSQDFDSNKRARFQNFLYLYNNLHLDLIEYAIQKIEDVTSAPLYFPIYINDRTNLQRYLAQHHIYLPVIWPVDDDEILIDKTVRNIYQKILCIPVDQRYDIEDMKKIILLIERFANEENCSHRC